MKILLCGHTGSLNRGCEAIIRSTSDILKQQNIDCVCASFDMAADKKAGLDKAVELAKCPSKNWLEKGVSIFRKKVLKDSLWGNKFFYENLLDSIKPDVILNVGGDTYCYDMPWLSIALNIEARKRFIPTVLWGCSVEEKTFSNEIMEKDINSYSYILSRESLTTEILKKHCLRENMVFEACDPAFHLQMSPHTLPSNFIVGNTLGINISPIMVGKDDFGNSMLIRNIQNLVKYVLKNSNMNVCLIPHVYMVNPPNGDFVPLRKLYECFKDTGRVSFIDEELSCTQLKYIISKCRFFIGARTHSMIAAYSNHIPAIALSYSIKSRGIAKDIFGSGYGYAVPKQSLTGENQLTELYIEYLLDKEHELKERYDEYMPGYKQSITETSKNIFNKIKEG